jgi:hypothetical protein
MSQFSPAQPAEIALRLVDAGFIVGIFDGVIDALGVELGR